VRIGELLAPASPELKTTTNHGGDEIVDAAGGTGDIGFAR
jgi:hypothetical protein